MNGLSACEGACEGAQAAYNARPIDQFSQDDFMFAKSVKLFLVASVALTATACSRNREAPTQLAPSRMTSIGVNAYLWRASIDTLSFAPLLQADANSGVIITDWYVNRANPGERVKLTVSILDQDLRADALRVAASRQIVNNGTWVDAPVSAATVQKLEDIILTRARDLRRGSVAG
jgi:hypothetical protein